MNRSTISAAAIGVGLFSFMLLAASAGVAFADNNNNNNNNDNNNHSLTVSGAGTGSGTVTSSDSQNHPTIDCSITAGVVSGDCSHNSFTTTLTATANTGSVFSGWSGDCSGSGTCSVHGGDSSNVTATFNIIPKPDLTATKTNDLTGDATVGVAFHWSIKVANTGTADASLGNNQVFLTDTLPTGATYGAPSVSTHDVDNDNNLSCSISSNTLTCKNTSSSHPVNINHSDGYFTVTFSATPTASGTLVNPKNGGTCAADPNGDITESNESNNSCSNSVTVDPATASLTVIKHVVNGDGGTASSTEWTLAVSSSDHGTGTGSAPGSETGTPYTIQAGKAYSVAESGGPSGYTEATSSDCIIASATAGHSYTCTITNTYVPPQTVTVIASKVVCQNESDLPQWGAGGFDPITATTASDWVEAHSSCSLVSGWNFEYGDQNAPDGGDSTIGPVADYTAFGPTDSSGSVTTTIALTSNYTNSIHLREELQSGYIPFTYDSASTTPNGNTVSAQFYCASDALNYDNWDFINNPQGGATYHCVAFNAPTPAVVPECNPNASTIIVSDVTTQEGGHNSSLVSLINSAWTAVITGAEKWIWGEDPVTDPTQQSTEVFTKTFNITGTPFDSTLTIAADNEYTVSVNGNTLDTGASGTTEDNYSATQTWDVPASDLVSGANTITFTVTNLQLDSDPQDATEATNPAGLLYTFTVNNDECTVPTPPATTIKVHIFKYLDNGDGSITQVADNSGLPSFPMVSSWNASNIGTGSGSYVLGNNEGGTALKYAADTSAMSVPADYSTSEVTGGDSPTVADSDECSPGDYYLEGYKFGSSLSAAETADISDAADFSGLTADEYVIVVNGTCPDSQTSTSSSDIGITKIVDNHTPDNGDTVTYTLTASDSGADATGVVINDPLPSGLTFVSTSSEDTVGVYDGTDWTIGDLSSTTPATLHIMATVNGNAEDGTPIINTATVTAGDTSDDTDNNSASASITPAASSGGGPTATSQTIVVKAADLTDDPGTNPTSWFFYNDQTNVLDNTLGSFVDGPDTAPLGEGSAQISATSTQGIVLGTFAYDGTPLSELSSLAYSTYRSAGDSALALALQFDINPDINVATTSYDGRLVYEPYYTHTVNDNTWQPWNPQDDSTSGGVGNWWFSKAWIATETGCSQATPCTWTQVLAKLPNIGISGGTYFKAGSNWSSDFTGNVDAFVIDTNDGSNATTTTYDFEPTDVAPPNNPTPNVVPGGGGGGGPISGPLSFGFNNGGVVLGTSTEATASSTSCGLYLTSFLRMGWNNPSDQVKKLQTFLNSYLGLSIPVTGFFGPQTFAAVEKFQTQQGQSVLAPWIPYGLPNANTPTGYVYKTTQREINLIECSLLNIPLPQLP